MQNRKSDTVDFGLCDDPALCSLDAAVHEAGMTTVFDRYESQQPQCKQGLTGTCCTLCANGPCRITAKSPAGVCGSSPDLIVSRNLLQKAAIGTAGNTYHAENAARALLAAGSGGAFNVRDASRLAALAATLGISAGRSTAGLAQEVASLIIHEINKPDNEEMVLVEALAPARRVAAWRQLGVMPGGVNAEIRTALVKCMTNVNNDPVDLLLTAMKLSIANAYAGLHAINRLQDILMGGAGIGGNSTNLGMLDPATVNISLTAISRCWRRW